MPSPLKYEPWKDSDLPAGYLRQRRNVMILCLVAIVFIAGGGSITGEVSLTWFGIQLSRPWIIYPAFLALYGYSYYRMIVYEPRHKGAFDWERKQELYKLEKFKEFCLARKDENPEKCVRPDVSLTGDKATIQFRWSLPDNSAQHSIVSGNSDFKIEREEFERQFWNHTLLPAWKNGKVGTDILLPRYVWWATSALIALDAIGHLVRWLSDWLPIEPQ